MEAHLERITETGYEEKKILIISNIEEHEYKLFFLPTLLHINIVKAPKIISISLGDGFSSDIFNSWLENLCNQFNHLPISHRIDYFNTELKKLIALGKKKKTLSNSELMGLYAELLHLNSLIEKFGDQFALNSWNNPAPTIHDFDLIDSCHEVKAVGRIQNEIKISSIDQLTANDGQELLLVVYVMNITKNQEKDSLGELYNKISSRLPEVLKNIFQQKCAQSKYATYLGPVFQPVNYKLDLLTTHRYKVEQESFPRIHRNNIHTSITQVKYSISIGSISKFKLDSNV